MRVDVPISATSEVKTPCGKQGCVVFYKGEHCLFCRPANEILKESLQQFGVPDNVICEIDVEEEEDIARERGIVGLPTIEICEETILGMPDEGSIRDALVRAIMQDCFCEGC
ncbi:MAG: thioredoxin domain-containing protein [Candidatus Thorarchaeota archaeon]